MNQKAFLEQVMPIKNKIYRLAKRLLISHDEAEDAVQETYIKLWNKRNTLNSYKSIEALAMTITKNFCLDRLKSKQASQQSLIDSSINVSSESLNKKIDSKDELTLVHKLINELPEQQRLVIQLRDIECYDYAEIEKILEMKPTAVRTNLSRARKTIREKITEYHAYGNQGN